MEEKIRQLEERIRQLEKPTKISDDWRRLLLAEGFLRFQKELFFTSAANIPFNYVFFETDRNSWALSSENTKSFVEFKVDPSNDTIISKNHGLTTDKQIDFYSSGDLPGGIDAPGIVYWVVNPTQDTFKVSLTALGTPVNITNGGTGLHYWKYFT